jgi:hypothetical protein
MLADHVQVEYIPSPSVNRVIPRCARNFCPTFNHDVRAYANRDAFSCALIGIVSIWFIVDIVLFSVAFKSNDKNVWMALGIVSTIIPASIFALATLITSCLYCGKIYRDSSEEITLEDHPDLQGSFDVEQAFMNDAFLGDIVERSV